MTSSRRRLRAPSRLPLAVMVIALFAVTAAPAYASHVGCGSLITTDTTLDSDVGPCAGDGLIVAADDVALDLGGHTVSGAGTGAGVRVARHTGVEVTGGTIEGFHTGLVLDEADGNHIWSRPSATTFAKGSRWPALMPTWSKRIRSSTTTATRSGWASPTGNVVRKNVAVGNVFGIGVADGSDGNLVEKNSVSATQVFGIAVFSSRSRQSRREERCPDPARRRDHRRCRFQRHPDHEERRQSQRRRRHRRRQPATTVTENTGKQQRRPRHRGRPGYHRRRREPGIWQRQSGPVHRSHLHVVGDAWPYGERRIAKNAPANSMPTGCR